MPLEGHLAFFLPLKTTHLREGFLGKEASSKCPARSHGVEILLWMAFRGELPGLDERFFHPFKRLGIAWMPNAINEQGGLPWKRTKTGSISS
jgi:hypothetical protein